MLTAANNPVTVWGPNSAGTTTITWNTGDAAVLGRVFMAVTENGIMGPETVFDGKTPAAAGSKPLPVRLGSAYRLQLRRASDNAVLDTLTVTVERIAAPVIVDHVSFGDLIDKLKGGQAITDLRVRAGIDTCRVSFKTAQPTIPVVTATAPDGTQVGASFPLFGGLRTEHEMLLGEVNALPQATEIALKIIAPGHNAFGQARERRALLLPRAVAEQEALKSCSTGDHRRIVAHADVRKAAQVLQAALPGVGRLERRDRRKHVPGEHHPATPRLTRRREVRGRRHPVMNLDEVDVESSERVDAGNGLLGRTHEKVR